jgi:hypothetical protein
MRVKFILSVIVVMALVVAGCGGGDSSGTGSGTGAASTDGTSSSEDGTTSTDTSDGSGKPLTKAEWAGKADAICQEVPKGYNEKLAELEEENGKKKLTLSEENLQAAVPPLLTAIEEMEELTPPKGEEKKVEEIIDALESAAKGVEEEPKSELSGPKSPFAEFQKLSGAYGMSFCSNL